MGNGDYRGISNEPPAGYWADTIADEGDLPAECATCNGNGLVVGWSDAFESHTIRTCPACGGTGHSE